MRGLHRGYSFGERLESQPSRSAPAEQPAAAPSPLETWFDEHKEGRGVWKWRHYFDIYHRHFARFVGREITMVEIGVFCGGSLGMWQSYFGPKCRIIGLDILQHCRTYAGGQVEIMIGDQSDPDFLAQVRAAAPVVDIVIDDGSHQPEHQIASFEGLFPHLSPGGVYLCEDIYASFNPFHDYMHGLTHRFNGMVPVPKPGVKNVHDGLYTNAVQREVQSVHHYPYVTVLEKRQRPVTEFSAPRMGTDWAGFQDAIRKMSGG